ncbi:TonB-dependent outer membrane receptor, SusC/RagA subfamily, signature region [Bacteroidales bacterium WCE2004]|jgi:TonB-dependent SusC/RagA subfamily outer membrane receptor|nr:TonB-dependent outer membrane receptor, SusC/RagA subfamily, signature region [Bacteroidales bacterium WCE2004]
MKRILLLFAVLTLSGAAVYGQEKVRDPKEKTQYSTVFDLLRNEPGVVIAPGGGNGVMPKIYIRGISTNSDQTQPLFVVDGIIMENVTHLLPEDIYSVEVIKDGTAASYGMRGQNGVIIFKTKSAAEAEKRLAEQQKAERQAAREARRAERKKKK